MCSVKFTISMDLCTIKIFRVKGEREAESLRRTIKPSVYSAINSQVLTISTTDLLNRTKWGGVAKYFWPNLDHTLSIWASKDPIVQLVPQLGGYISIEHGFATNCKNHPYIESV